MVDYVQAGDKEKVPSAVHLDILHAKIPQPTMSTLVSMLVGEADVDDNLSKPGLISERIEIKVGGVQKYNLNSSALSGMTTSVARTTLMFEGENEPELKLSKKQRLVWQRSSENKVWGGER